MTREEAVKEIEKAFEPAFANYIITALTEGATVSDKEPTTKNDLGFDCISRKEVLRLLANSIGKTNTYLQTKVLKMSSVTPQEPILDKIRAEISKAWYTHPQSRYEEGLKDQALRDMKIIDRHIAESEV